ncbi:hypothetical protein WJ99_21465 [Burkholderia ubonensis]|nr:FAD-dependent oxidoreductase [Burkholderia ubonensis]KVD13670.1 hypothetical protein WI79_28735 [Burkholderia ubonensis]KVD40151.1 hypothetical protein WI84_08695 [Burkholderia ubonensis]KVQ08977.1 hypothetical protein WJ99_21465 [Burkholderia ubonensis]KVQ94464.1 hypothetical protein WK08_08955 [Burkholderia ubonensis]KVW33736.1 hypothetical protein WK94_31485 [Burkholderia ubonensis]
MEYRRLERELGRPLDNWSGALTYGVGDGAAPRQDARVDWLDCEQVGRLEPNLLDPPSRARYARDEGTLEPAEATRVHVEHACAHRALYRGDTDVRSLCVGVRTETDELCADIAILATGAQTAALAATAGIVPPLRVSPVIRLRMAVRRGLVKTLVSNAEIVTSMSCMPVAHAIAGIASCVPVSGGAGGYAINLGVRYGCTLPASTRPPLPLLP